MGEGITEVITQLTNNTPRTGLIAQKAENYFVFTECSYKAYKKKIFAYVGSR